MVPGEGEPAAGVLERRGWRGRPSSQPVAEITEHGNQRGGRAGQVRGEVATAGDALLGGDVDEQQGASERSPQPW